MLTTADGSDHLYFKQPMAGELKKGTFTIHQPNKSVVVNVGFRRHLILEASPTSIHVSYFESTGTKKVKTFS